MTRPPYSDHFIGVEPRVAIDPQQADPFVCSGGIASRSPEVTKGKGYQVTTDVVSLDCCDPGDDCCGPGECC